ncbi:MAG: alkylhydroperoxidase-related (seleno)protein, partial [Candidatus Tectomicrobia bacterium]
TAANLTALTDDVAAATSGIEHGEVLIAFAEAVVGSDDVALAQAREAVITAMSAEALVDAAGVASNFERMVRIADSTGIPLDDRMAQMTKTVRDELQLERFAGSKNMA